jgi:hypothetical protein
LFSWRLERQTGSGWDVVPEHSADDQAASEYQVTEELPDGAYRFGVAERNAGGERSAFFVTEGTGSGDYVEFTSVIMGPAGGYIFYDKGFVSDGWRYLEAAPVDQSDGHDWSSITDQTIPDGTSLGFGAGATNTTAIIAQPGHTQSAAQLCRNYSGGGANDWYLPTETEKAAMKENLYDNAVGNFSVEDYWTSQQGGFAEQAWRYSFVDIYHLGARFVSKSTENHVRAVRTLRSLDNVVPSYTVRYFKNPIVTPAGTGGTLPVDPYHYEAGESWTVPDQGDLNAPEIHAFGFGGWNTAPDGSGTSYRPGPNTFPPGGNLALYAQWIPNPDWDGDYNLGDVGPACGIIFYVDYNNEHDGDEGWTYLEAAPKNTENELAWADPALEVVDARGNLIGDGPANTIAISDAVIGDGQGRATRAASYCQTLNENTFNDWFLPSEDEMLAMVYLLQTDNAGSVNLVPDVEYWTSTEVDDGSIPDVGGASSFSSTLMRIIDMPRIKTEIRYVRAVRRF